MMTIAELKSSTESGNKYHQTRNGMKFSHFETLAVVQTVKSGASDSGDEYLGVVLEAPFQASEQVTSISAFASRFSSDLLKSVMFSLVERSLVIIRGRISFYTTTEGETKMGVYPDQIIEVTDPATRDLWYYSMLESRVRNRVPFIIGDDIYILATELDLPSASVDGDDGMVIFSPATGVARSVEVPAVPVTSAPSIQPAQKPALPAIVREQARKDEPGDAFERFDDDTLIKYVANSTGQDISDVQRQVADVVEGSAGLVTQRAAIGVIAQHARVDMNGLVRGERLAELPSQPRHRAPPLSSPVPPDIETVIMEHLSRSGTAKMADIYAKVKNELGVNDNVTQNTLIDMFADGKVFIDMEDVSLP